MIKLIVCTLFVLSVVPVSIAGMVYGWGITPESWGWVAFSYLWVMVVPVVVKMVEEK